MWYDTIFNIVHPESGEVVQILDESDGSCNPMFGYCGGCVNCLMMQASHCGFDIVPRGCWTCLMDDIRETWWRIV